MQTDRKKPEVTTAIILDKRALRKTDNKYPVKLRVIYDRTAKYYTVKGEAYTVDEFKAIKNPDNRGENKKKRKKLEAIENRAIYIIDEVLTSFSFDAFEKEYNSHKAKNNSIESYFTDKVEELKNDNKFQSEGLYRATHNALKSFDSKVSFSKITPSYLMKFEGWMLNEGKSYTTVGVYMRNLKHIINRAIRDRVMIEYPFGNESDKYSIPQSRNIKKALTIYEIEKLFKYNPKNPQQKEALKYWLFSYLCNGMNLTDIARIQYKNIEGKNLTFVRQKTKNTAKDKTFINVYLLPEAMRIIEELGNSDESPENFVFPILKPGLTELEKHRRIKQHIKTVNKHMKSIAKEIGINRGVTTYFARHSFSTVLKRSGAPIEFISEQLGHMSTKVTRNYLDSFENEQREKYSESLTNFINN